MSNNIFSMKYIHDSFDEGERRIHNQNHDVVELENKERKFFHQPENADEDNLQMDDIASLDEKKKDQQAVHKEIQFLHEPLENKDDDIDVQMNITKSLDYKKKDDSPVGSDSPAKAVGGWDSPAKAGDGWRSPAKADEGCSSQTKLEGRWNSPTKAGDGWSSPSKVVDNDGARGTQAASGRSDDNVQRNDRGSLDRGSSTFDKSTTFEQGKFFSSI